MPLVDNICQQITIRNHPVTAIERRFNHLSYKLGPRRHVEQHLGSCGKCDLVTVQQDGANRIAGRRRAGVATGYN